MKIVLLYSLLTYQLVQYGDATGNGSGWCFIVGYRCFCCLHAAWCSSLQVVRAGTNEADTATRLVDLGSTVEICSNENDYNQPGKSNYTFLHENHHTGELDIISQQESHKFILSNVQLTNSGIYCAYKQCAPQEKEQCCLRIIG